jgi:TonB family protein
MHNLFRLLVLLLLGVTAPAWAAFESIKIEVTEEPQIPANLMMTGLSNGQVVVAIDVGADGQLTDWLVLAASHRELIKPCIESMKRWRYTPARFEDQAVPARMELTVDISQKGAVVSRLPNEVVNDMIERLVGRAYDYKACPADEIDRPPAAIVSVAPRYASDAEKLGVRGSVTVHFFIDEQGAVRLPAVSADAHPYLSTLAIDAMKNWKFEQPTRRGKPVLVAAAQQFDFGVEK